MSRKYTIAKKNKTCLGAKIIKEEVDGSVSMNGKELIRNKDYFLTKDGIRLSDEMENKLEEATSYSMYYSRKIMSK